MGTKNAGYAPGGAGIGPVSRLASSAEAAVYAAAALSLAAALVHLWVAPGHFELWWGYGAFFLAAASALDARRETGPMPAPPGA